MKKNTWLKGLSALVIGSFVLAGCSGNSEEEAGTAEQDTEVETTIAMVADTGGVDDKSFNQSAWEGLQSWGEKHDLEQGTDGYDYLQSQSDSDYVTNFTTLAGNEFDTVFGVGFRVSNALEEVASQREDTNFVIIDGIIEDLDNVASVTFRDNEAGFLAGVAAAKTTKTNKVGFVGGQNNEVIDRFEAGYRQGVAIVDDSIEIEVQYVGSFTDPAKAKAQAAAMYNSGVDIIYHAAGNSGNGVFAEAKDLKKQDSSKEIWVIGVDKDQSDEGVVGDDNITLASTTKEVGNVVEEISDQTMDGEFPGGEHLISGLEDGGVSITDGQLSDEVLELVAQYQEEIISGELEVAQSPSDLN